MPAAHRPLRPRRPARGDGRLAGGVAAGLGQALGLDPLVVRVAFVVGCAAGGTGAVLYALLWLLLPGAARGEAPAPARLRPTRAALEVGAGAALLCGAALLTLRELGWWFSDAIAWPVVLVAGGGALLWRAGQLAADRVVAPPAPAPATPVEARAARAAAARARALLAGGGGLGLVMVLGAGVVFLWLTGALGAARDALLPAATLLVVLAVVGAPLWVRLVRALSAERDGRIRSQERAELAAHVHDSVLQTLALVQQRAEDPRAVVALARRQERELRGWLNGDGARDGDHRLAAALEGVADEVEADHGVPVEVVAVGDAALDDRGRALVAATREAVVNAAKWGGGSAVDVYAEAAASGALRVYVRDRGPGFDPAAVPDDRRGVRESILGRMERHGGTAQIHSTPGMGTEVELALEGRGA